jgi:hypothetical protein
MKTSYLLIVSLTCLMGLAACGGSESASADQPIEPISSLEPITPAPQSVAATPPAEQFVAGQLAEIDMNAKTFVLKDAKGDAYAFEYSETTKLTGGGGAQNLSGQEGHNATVRYVESNNRKSAVQIHVEMGS